MKGTTVKHRKSKPPASPLWLRLHRLAFMVMVCSAVIGALLAILQLLGLDHTDPWGYVRGLVLLVAGTAYWLTTRKAAAKVDALVIHATDVAQVSS
jgi:hypothetical protein